MRELNSVALYPIIAMLWQCSENYAGLASLTLAVGDKGFRRKSSYLFACGKAFLVKLTLLQQHSSSQVRYLACVFSATLLRRLVC